MRDRIEEVLRDHNRPCSVAIMDVAPHLLRFQLIPLHRRLSSGKPSLYKTTVGQLKRLVPDLEVALGISPISVEVRDGELWLSTPRTPRSTVLARDMRRVQGEVPLVLGRSVDGRELTIDLTSPVTPSALIGGTTGSGKTMLLHSVIYGLCKFTSPVDTYLILVDTNSPDPDLAGELTLSDGGGLGVWNGVSHLHSLITTPQDALAVFRGIKNLLEKRYRMGSPPVPRYVVIIDELADLLGDSSYGDEIESLVGGIAQISRKKGVHLVAATQRPDAEVIKGMAKANFPARIAMTVASSIDSRIIIDQTGAERLNGRGDGLLRVGMEVTRFQGALVEQEDVDRVKGWKWEVEHESLVEKVEEVEVGEYEPEWWKWCWCENR